MKLFSLLRTALVCVFCFLLAGIRPAFALIPSDPLYSEQWYLPKVHAERAWDITTGSPDVVVAILDSGVDITHPDLQQNIWKNEDEVPGNGRDDDQNGYVDDVNGWDFLRNTPDPRPKFDEVYTVPGVQHGTIIAGIAAARGSNAEGIAGISFQSQIMPLRVLDSRGIGKIEDVVKALDYAIQNGADVVNLSFVGTSVASELIVALERARLAGVVVVAPSGNDRERGGIDLDVEPRFPVCHDQGKNLVLGVAAIDERDKRASFSNYGEQCVDVSAPGVSLFSTQFYRSDVSDFQNKYGGWWSGTSLAAPIVSGTVALMRAVNPTLSPSQIIELIRSTADSIVTQNPTLGGKLGAGRLNIAAAVQAARDASGSGGRIRFARRAEYIVTAAGSGGSEVRVYTFDGRLVSQFRAYEPSFRGGAEAVLIDRDGDGTPEIFTVPGQGREPLVKVFSLDGKPLTEFYAYTPLMKRGLHVASADVNGDKKQDIIVSPRSGGGPHVRIFDTAGNVLGEFMAFDKQYRGGVRVAGADIDSDGSDEVLALQSANGDGQVHIFERNGKERFSFATYGKRYAGEMAVTAGDVDGDGFPEIIIGMGSGAAPHVRVFDRAGVLVRQMSAYDERFQRGIEVSTVDVDGDGRREIITGVRSGGGPHVRVFAGDGFLRSQFFAFPLNFRGGISVGGG